MNESCFNIYAGLFNDVQKSQIFSDSKTFTDAIPLIDPQIMQQQYEEQKNAPGFSLQHFVEQHFR